MKKLLLLLLTLPLLALLGLGGLSCASAQAPASGLLDGALRPCPDSPNCVSSQAEPDSPAHIAPLDFEGDPAAAFERLVAWINQLPRTEQLALEPGYAHFEFTTRLLRFRDDLELQLDAGARKIHVRSASRVGHSDLGTNRARVESIREGWPARP